MVDEFIVSENVAVMDVLIAIFVALFAGLVDDIVGAVVSRIIESLAETDTFPAASLNQTYTVFVPSPMLNVNDTLAEE